MVCRRGGTESFAWLAEIFVCPICGDHDYVFPICAAKFDCECAGRAEEVEESEEEDGTRSLRSATEIVMSTKKRKRADSENESSE